MFFGVCRTNMSTPYFFILYYRKFYRCLVATSQVPSMVGIPALGRPGSGGGPCATERSTSQPSLGKMDANGTGMPEMSRSMPQHLEPIKQKDFSILAYTSGAMSPLQIIAASGFAGNQVSALSPRSQRRSCQDREQHGECAITDESHTEMDQTRPASLPRSASICVTHFQHVPAAPIGFYQSCRTLVYAPVGRPGLGAAGHESMLLLQRLGQVRPTAAQHHGAAAAR